MRSFYIFIQHHIDYITKETFTIELSFIQVDNSYFDYLLVEYKQLIVIDHVCKQYYLKYYKIRYIGVQHCRRQYRDCLNSYKCSSRCYPQK